MGPSTTFGRGCPLQHLRWSDVLQNLSNFTGSPLPLRVINEARPATPLHTQWRSILGSYQHDPKVDLIVLDYAVTSTDKSQSHKSAVMIHTFLQGWRRPPAILFVETFSVTDMTLLAEGTSACNFARDFESMDPFYSVAKALKLPLLSYPDIACHLPALNRTSGTGFSRGTCRHQGKVCMRVAIVQN